MSENLLVLKDLSIALSDQFAINNLNLTIQKGEIIALVGPSGSGKSTIMNLITRVMKPDSGSILLESVDVFSITDTKEYAKKVGLLRQQFDLVNNLLVVHNVLAGRLNEWGLGKSLLSLFKPQDAALAQAALQRVGLENKLSEITSRLSGGEQQRVAIARLLVQDPIIYLADEPISSLDPVNARQVLSLLTTLVRRENKTLIASLHSVDFAREYFDRMIGLRGGSVMFDLPASEVSEEILDELYRMED